MPADKYRKLSDARRLTNEKERKKMVEEYLESLALPLDMSPMSLLKNRGFAELPSGSPNFTEIFLESFAKKMRNAYNKEMFKPRSPEQLQQFTDKLNEAELEVKIYQILQKQVKYPKDAAMLTEQLLSKSDNFRKIVCQHPEALRWLVEKSTSHEVLKKIHDSSITDSQHWGKNIHNRDTIELEIKLKYGISNDRNKYAVNFEIYSELIKKWSEISEKARQTNVSIRVNIETRDILSKLSTLYKATSDDTTLQLNIQNAIKNIKDAVQTHETAAKAQTTQAKASHYITHLREAAKGVFKNAKGITSQTAQLIAKNDAEPRPVSKRK